MDKDFKSQQSDKSGTIEEKAMDRRAFLAGLGKWSTVIIGAALFGGALLESNATGAAWANRGGGGGAWANRGGGGGGAWANRGAAWANRGGAWVNRF